MEIRKLKSLKRTGLIVLFFCLVLGCKKNEDSVMPEIPAGQALVQINMLAPEYESENTVGPRSVSSAPNMQVQRTKVNQDINMIAELVPDSNTAAGPMKRAGSSTPLPLGTRYRLLVYNKGTGDPQGGGYGFITGRDYIYGQESQTEPLLLDGGKEYIFVAYSVNSVTELPPYYFANHGGSNERRELYYTTLRAIDGSTDVLYFRKDVKITNSSTNYLDVVFKHLFNQVTITLDTEALGMNIKEIKNTLLKPVASSLDVALIEGRLNNLALGRDLAITFPAVASNINIRSISSDPIVFLSRTTASFQPEKPKLSLGYLRLATGSANNVGFITTNIEVGEFDMKPGVKYNLNIKLTSNDQLGTYFGQPVVRIGGMVWKRFNEGTTVTVNPDIIRAGIVGNQWAWGHKNYAGIGNSLLPVNGWQQYVTVINSPTTWNAVTNPLVAPAKGVNDPCSNGFRVPTDKEYTTLLAITDKSYLGNWIDDLTNISSGFQLSSIANPAIKITFPAAGERNDVTGTLSGTNRLGRYFTTLQNPDGGAWAMMFERDKAAMNYQIKTLASSLRCIAATSDFIKL